MPKNTLIIDNYHNASTTFGVTLGIIALIITCILIWYYFNNIKRFFIDLHNNVTDDNVEYSNDVDVISQMKQEVFNVDQNVFTYDEAKVACEALGAKLATKKQMDEAQKDGANWCNNGWVEDQMALWPIQEGYIKSVKGTHLEGKCGKPGLNGGYQPDKNLKLSANCYGYRPRPNENYIHYLEKIMKNTNNEPELINKYRKMFASKDLFVAPHSDVQWSEFSKYISDYKLGDYYPRDDIESSKYASVNGNNGNKNNNGNNGNKNNNNGNKNNNGNNGNKNNNGNTVNGTDNSKLGNSSGTFTGENSLDKEDPSYCDNSKALNYGSLGSCEYEPNGTYESNYASAENGSPENGSPENGSPENGSPENGSPENGSPENGSPENGSPENGSPENGSPENGSPENGSPENGSPENGSPENGSPENGSPENGSPENGSPESDCPNNWLQTNYYIENEWKIGEASSYQDCINQAKAQGCDIAAFPSTNVVNENGGDCWCQYGTIEANKHIKSDDWCVTNVNGSGAYKS
jgi:hypothetical protein